MDTNYNSDEVFRKMETQEKTNDTKISKIRKKLGDLLIDAGLIDNKTLKQALEVQKGTNKKIGQILMDMGVVDDIEIAKALSTQLKIPFISLKEKEVPKEITSIVPADMAENYLLVPLSITNGALLVAMANPLEFYALDDLRFITKKKIDIAISPQSEILNAIERHYPKPGLEKEFGWEGVDRSAIEFIRPLEEDDKDIQKLMKITELPPVVRFANTIFADAIKLKASDIHIEPQKTSVFIRYRIDGIMREIMQTDKHVHASLVSRIKVLANMDISVRRRPQDGRSQVRFANTDFDLRVSSIPTSYGEKLTIRILNPDFGKRFLGDLGLPQKSLNDLENALSRPQGMTIVTGPTGSGKSSTLYAFLNTLNSPEVNIITVEDPIEYRIPFANQQQVNKKGGVTFEALLKSAVRQDPDILFMGEVRDQYSAKMSMDFASTGHLTITTLHTSNATTALFRIERLGIKRGVMADAVLAVVAQRLIKKLCPHCKKIEKISTEEAEMLSRFMEVIPSQVAHPVGCPRCGDKGYHGREGLGVLFRAFFVAKGWILVYQWHTKTCLTCMHMHSVHVI